MRPGRVIVVFLSDRAEDGQFVGVPGDQGEMLADVDPRNIGADRQEFAAGGFGTMRFQVPGILMGGPPPHKEQDDAFGPAKGSGPQVVSPGRLSQQVGQPQPPRSQGANLQGGPPG